MLSPYVVKRIVRNALAGVPVLRALRDRVSQPSNYADPLYNVSVVSTHASRVARLAPFSIEGARILELGPGGNLGNALLLWLYGAERVYCVDNYRHVDFQPTASTYWSAFADWLTQQDDHACVGGARGHSSESAIPHPPFMRQRLAQVRRAGSPAGGEAIARQLHALVEHGTVQYLAPVDAAALPLPDASVDWVFSQAVLEHVSHPDRVVCEMARVLAPGGLLSHQVDLRDHFKAGTVDMLRYSRVRWTRMSSHSHGYVNRWRRAQFADAVRAAGLDLLAAEATERLPTAPDPTELDAEFRTFSREELSVVGLFLVARKSGQ